MSNGITNEFGRRGQREKGARKSDRPIRKASREVVLDTIRKELKHRISVTGQNPGKERYCTSFSAEELAYLFHFKIDKIQWALHKLNLEGLVSQGRNGIPHDVKRSTYFQHGDVEDPSGWNPTWYELRV